MDTAQYRLPVFPAREDDQGAICHFHPHHRAEIETSFMCGFPILTSCIAELVSRSPKIGHCKIRVFPWNAHFRLLIILVRNEPSFVFRLAPKLLSRVSFDTACAPFGPNSLFPRRQNRSFLSVL